VNPHYSGLCSSVESFKRPAAAELDSIPSDFPEVAKVPALARLMVNMDERWDHIKAIRKAGWQSPTTQPDLDPAHEAMLLRESYREATRLPDVQARPQAMRDLLVEAERTVGKLEEALRSPVRGAVEPVFKQIQDSCRRCHEQFRDKGR